MITNYFLYCHHITLLGTNKILNREHLRREILERSYKHEGQFDTIEIL